MFQRSGCLLRWYVKSKLWVLKMEVFITNIFSATVVGIIYTFFITLVTLQDKPIYTDKEKDNLKKSYNARLAITTTLYLFLCFIMPAIFFMLFWNNAPYSRRTESFAITLNIFAVLLSAIIAHLAYNFMKRLVMKSSK